MTREETFNILCTIIEETDGRDIEEVSNRIMDALEVIGEDLLDHLDPPVGLRRWLESHGLSLVVSSEVTPPQVWEALQGEDRDDDEVVEDLGEGLGAVPLPQVGDYVEFHTAPAGPRGQSHIGSGRINAITSEGWVIVQDSPTHEEWLNPETDAVRIVTSPPVP